MAYATENLQTFVEKHLRLLEIEREAELERIRIEEDEKQQQRELKWKTISNSEKIKGKIVVKFEDIGIIQHDRQPSTSVVICDVDIPYRIIASGTIVKVFKRYIDVVITVNEEDSFYWKYDTSYYIVVDKKTDDNDVTYHRMQSALMNLHMEETKVKDVLFGVNLPEEPLSKFTYPDGNEMQFVNEKLNGPQKEAVVFALRQRDVAIIHGPPGTGKTTTVVEIIIQAVKAGQKILACAPSNVAVDNLVQKLAENQMKVIRLGLPERTMPHLKRHCFDNVLTKSAEFQKSQHLKAELIRLRGTCRPKSGADRMELHEMEKQLHKLTCEVKSKVLSKADVILATLISASRDGPLKYLPRDHFDLVVIDECAQGIEAACWVSLTDAKKCILAGDHHQLPPTVISEKAAKGGLRTSLMERILNNYRYNPRLVVRMLTIQCRMNERIMAWSSQQFYANRVKSDASVKSRLLSQMARIKANENTSIPLLLIDTTGCGLYENDSAKMKSKFNEGEAVIVCAHVKKLISSGVPASSIGIISPYKCQVQVIAQKLRSQYPEVEVNTVDSYQGREKEAIVISLVRANSKGIIGFLAEYRRMNVAITRAMRHLAVIGDRRTISSDKTLKSLMDYIADEGEVRSASMYLPGKNLKPKLPQNNGKNVKGNVRHSSRPSKTSNQSFDDAFAQRFRKLDLEDTLFWV